LAVGRRAAHPPPGSLVALLAVCILGCKAIVSGLPDHLSGA
jgi:hypothetical protein